MSFDTLSVRDEGRVRRVTIDHPPINLLDAALIGDLMRLVDELEHDDAVSVVVFDSANEEFFVAHADVNLILAMSSERHARPSELPRFHRLVEQVRTLPQLTVAVVEGRARGGGSELALSMDLRFAAVGRAVFGQPEVAIGIIPGGSGTQRIARLAGRGRALEMVVGCDDVDALRAEQWGLVNRALPPGDLRPFVDALAARVASFPPESVRAAKAAVDAALGDPTDGLLAEADCFNAAWSTGTGRRLIRRFLELGGQTREVELDLPAIFEDLPKQ